MSRAPSPVPIAEHRHRLIVPGPLGMRWADSLGRAERWVPPAVPTVVVVPHPDDEALMTGGLIAHQTAAGVPVTVLAVTDGEAAYPDRDLLVDLADLRRAEQRRAITRLGLSSSSVVRLGLPDGRVAGHLDVLVERLDGLVPDGGLVVAPTALDHHCDHVAAGVAGAIVAERRDVTRVESVFWMWHHASPADLAGRTVLALELAAATVAVRNEAVAQHASQVGEELTEPLLGPADLEPLGWPVEYFLRPAS